MSMGPLCKRLIKILLKSQVKSSYVPWGVIIKQESNTIKQYSCC
uniref:Uncharacterized protein n=1 Tax=Rhizophora mucronata TaxID=61149 RepID=A0A2P2QIG4_RHIMU